MTIRTSCLTGVDPLARASVPSDSDFAEGDDYLEAPEIKAVAEAVIDFYGVRFSHMAELRIGYLWRKEAKKHQGKPVLGYAGKTSGVLKYMSQCDFVIEVAADLARILTNFQIEAIVFHELLHCGINVDEKGNSKPVVVGHDTEMFRAELETYGYWKPDLIATGKTFRQISLPSEPADFSAERLVRESLSGLSEDAGARQVFQDMADKDGITTTISSGVKSVTIAPKRSRAAST